MPLEHLQSRVDIRPEIAPHPDVALTELANRQHGVVARWQLAAEGVTLSMLKTRVARGSLTRLHRGVYAVGHRRLRPEAHSLAAVLAVGPGAVASHRDAAWLHGLRPGNHRQRDVSTGRRIAGSAKIRVHRTAVLTADDVTQIGAIPVTSLARTLVDLAGLVPGDHLAKAVSEAERIHRVDVRAIEAAMARTRHRAGAGNAALAAVLAEHRVRGLQLTRRELERRFLALFDGADLPRPRTNAVVDGLEVDAVWQAARVAVELDGWEFHRHRRAFQRDREKANALALAGWTLLRFTHYDVVHRRRDVLDQLRRAVARP